MFDPNQQGKNIEAYLSRHLGGEVALLQAEQLTQSTRQAPWRLDVKINDVRRSFVLQMDERDLEDEYLVLRALEDLPIPTPRVYGWDRQGEALGVACFFSDFIEGESLLKPLLAGEAWAAEVYLDAVCAMQSITEQQLSSVRRQLRFESAEDLLEATNEYFQNVPHLLAERAYTALKTNLPALPELRFSNGDLWLDNFLVRDRQLTGVIDFTAAGFSDPIYEFLLSFFVAPELRNRGIEELYCRKIGWDPAVLQWYHGLEFFETWRYVSANGKPFVQHTAESLMNDLAGWLAEMGG